MILPLLAENRVYGYSGHKCNHTDKDIDMSTASEARGWTISTQGIGNIHEIKVY